MSDATGSPSTAGAKEPGAAGSSAVPAVPTETGAGSPSGTPNAAPLSVGRTRTSSTYVGVGVGLLVLILVLIFVVQNLHESSVHFITLRFRLPQGVIVLASAVAGGLIVLLVSLARVVQLRRGARRHKRQHANAVK